MKKQVIIDKGNGMQQRLSYDDGTNKIIPETTFGPRQTDNVLPVVGKKFITDTGLSVAYGEDCLFCKGKKNTSGIPFDTQCAILSGFKIYYSPCFGPLFQTILYTVEYNGPHKSPSDYGVWMDFFDKTGTPFTYYAGSLQGGTFSGNSVPFYLHQNSINKVEIRVSETSWTKVKGECVLTIQASGASVTTLYKDNENMKVIFDPTRKRLKYINLNKNKNKNYIDVVVGEWESSPFSYLFRMESGKTYDLNVGWNGIAVFSNSLYWTAEDALHLVGYSDSSNTLSIAILGYEGLLGGIYTNLFPVTVGILPRDREEDNPGGG
jgi:hypothetical protein